MKIGDYVRTKNGFLGKVNKIELKGSGVRYAGEFITDTIIQFNDGKVYERRVRDKDIIKHSKNIIDLIEVGDYVNGNKVVETYKDSKKQDELYLEVVVSSKMIKEPLTDYIEEDRIKSILTKEQYEANCYRLEE